MQLIIAFCGMLKQLVKMASVKCLLLFGTLGTQETPAYLKGLF